MEYLFAAITLAAILAMSFLTYRLGRIEGMLKSLRMSREYRSSLGLSTKEIEKRERS